MVDVTSVTTSNSLHHATYYLGKVISHAPPTWCDCTDQSKVDRLPVV